MNNRQMTRTPHQPPRWHSYVGDPQQLAAIQDRAEATGRVIESRLDVATGELRLYMHPEVGRVSPRRTGDVAHAQRIAEIRARFEAETAPRFTLQTRALTVAGVVLFTGTLLLVGLWWVVNRINWQAVEQTAERAATIGGALALIAIGVAVRRFFRRGHCPGAWHK